MDAGLVVGFGGGCCFGFGLGFLYAAPTAAAVLATPEDLSFDETARTTALEAAQTTLSGVRFRGWSRPPPHHKLAAYFVVFLAMMTSHGRRREAMVRLCPPLRSVLVTVVGCVVCGETRMPSTKCPGLVQSCFASRDPFVMLGCVAKLVSGGARWLCGV